MSLKEFRDNLGLTQNQMADEIGVSKSYYSMRFPKVNIDEMFF